MNQENEITLEDFELAEGWKIFSAKHPHNDVERDLRPFLAAEKKEDWLRKARISSLISIREMAKRLNISEASYYGMETRAKFGDISLKNLERCADAMDCEVVYAIRPKSRTGFSIKIWEFLLTLVRKDWRLRNVSSGRRGPVLALLAERLLYDPKFRKSQGWAKNSEEAAYDTLKMIEADNACRNVVDSEVMETLVRRKIIKL